MIIGLTGSIASGKSTVSQILKQQGFPIVDADLVARKVVEPGSPTLKEIAVEFGPEIIDANGSLDRPKLGELIFNDPELRKNLNNIIHPAIRKEMLRERDEFMDRGYETIVMDIPLLFESGLQHFVDKILVVSVTEDNQLRRLMKRNGLPEHEAKARIASQLPMSLKEKGADAVINNNGTLEDTERQVLEILSKWKENGE